MNKTPASVTNILGKNLTCRLYQSMSGFDFHHHKKYQNGIYNLSLGETVPDFGFSVGLHPKDLDENAEENFLWVIEISQNKNCLAIGECGLDALVKVDEGTQEHYFQKHIEWANEIKKPIIIHCVRRFSQLLKFKKTAEIPMIIHGFNKKKIIANELLHAGFYLCFGKAVLHNVSLHAVIKDVSLDRIFLETDDAEVNIDDLYQKVAELKSISIENLKNQIAENLIKIGIEKS